MKSLPGANRNSLRSVRAAVVAALMAVTACFGAAYTFSAQPAVASEAPADSSR